MSTSESHLNTSNLHALESEVALTKEEMEEFRKLPKSEQERQMNEKIVVLSNLRIKLDRLIQEAIQTGCLDEARNLNDLLEKEVHDLEEQMQEGKVNIVHSPEYDLAISIYDQGIQMALEQGKPKEAEEIRKAKAEFLKGISE